MITEILPSVGAVLGVPGATDTLGLADRLGPARRVVVLLVDGLGYHLLPRSPALLAATAGARLDELACTLPSTTPTSLVSLATGMLPGQHGIVGFTVRVPGTDRLLTHVRWRDDPDPARWQPVPTMYQRAAAAGLEPAVVLPAAFAGSGLTVAAYRGARFVGLAAGEDPAPAVRRALDGGARLVFGYLAAVDTAAHEHGIDSAQWAAAATGAAALIERLVHALPADAALLVTADHGGLDIPQSTRIDVADDPRLSDGVRLIAGEVRCRYLYVRDGAADDVCQAWGALMGDRTEVMTREQAVASGMFGTVAPQHLPRIGDVVVLCRGETAVLAGGHEPPEVAALVGMHGAGTPAETAIPLISFAAS